MTHGPHGLLPTTVIGSYAMPGWLWTAVGEIDKGSYGETDVRETFDDGVNIAYWTLGAGPPLIGAMAAHGVWLAMVDDASDVALERACESLIETRPTAVNLRWALDRMRCVLSSTPPDGRVDAAFREAAAICDEDVATSEAIGEHGESLLREAW